MIDMRTSSDDYHPEQLFENLNKGIVIHSQQFDLQVSNVLTEIIISYHYEFFFNACTFNGRIIRFHVGEGKSMSGVGPGCELKVVGLGRDDEAVDAVEVGWLVTPCQPQLEMVQHVCEVEEQRCACQAFAEAASLACLKKFFFFQMSCVYLKSSLAK